MGLNGICEALSLQQYGIWNVVLEELLTSKDRKVAHIIPSRLEHKTEHEFF